MAFAPYIAAVQYGCIVEDFQEANLQDAKCWDNIVDFRWHRSSQSPNWHILSEALRITGMNGEHSDERWGGGNNNSACPIVASSAAASTQDKEEEEL